MYFYFLKIELKIFNILDYSSCFFLIWFKITMLYYLTRNV